MRGDDLKWSSDYNQSWLLVTDELTSVVLSPNNFKIKARKKDFHFYQVYQASAPHLGECYQGWLARSSDKNDGWCSADDISGVMSLITSHQLWGHDTFPHLTSWLNSFLLLSAVSQLQHDINNNRAVSGPSPATQHCLMKLLILIIGCTNIYLLWSSVTTSPARHVSQDWCPSPDPASPGLSWWLEPVTPE